jgi:hypothetical protein
LDVETKNVGPMVAHYQALIRSSIKILCCGSCFIFGQDGKLSMELNVLNLYFLGALTMATSSHMK